MNELNQIFTIHPVGQGLFYSGSIELKQNSGTDNYFNFVFDCGSLTSGSMTNEIEEFKNRPSLRGNAPLDLLIVSHFDADHINGIAQLLEGGRQVKNLVLPFLNYSERLFIVLRYLATSGYDDLEPRSDFPVRFMIDPIGTLSENLGGDSNIYLISGGPNGPKSDPEGDSENFRKDDDIKNLSLLFNFEGQCDKLSKNNSKEFGVTNTQSRLYKVPHRKKGLIQSVGIQQDLMVFLFYRRSIGKDTDAFFKKIAETFINEAGIKEDSPTFLHDVIKSIKKMRGATKVKEIFKKALREEFDVDGDGRPIENMNTTALCCLHKNLKGLYQTMGKNRIVPIHRRLENITKIKGVKRTRRIYPDYFPYVLWPSDIGEKSTFPNCLLSSDAFLKTEREVMKFCAHYKDYWNDFFLAQVPHHGSRHNADRNLFSRISPVVFMFINYGVRHWFDHAWKHPSEETIMELTLTGHSGNLLPVHEHNGVEFSLNIHR